MPFTHNQQIVLATLAEHKRAGGHAIGTRELDHELDLRHNRHMGYDAMYSLLRRLNDRGLVVRTMHRPARYEISEAGEKALAADGG